VLSRRIPRSLLRFAPAALIALGVVGTVAELRHQGRIWWCACRSLNPWHGDIWSAHCSQHLFDPYSFTHVLHGVVFCGILALLLPKLAPRWKLVIVVLLECFWEMLENSQLVIQRYREATIGLGYEGDSIVNSLSDILCCVTGFLLASRLKLRGSLVLFITVELILLLWIRDNLSLNVLMLLVPIDAIKRWQMVH